MKCRPLSLAEVIEITPSRFSDDRGYFSETFRQDWFEREVAAVAFVQENQSLTHSRGVVRGLHYQKTPMAQGKLVRCISGAIFDVAVDIRKGSPSFGKWTSAVLSADAGNQLWIPPGFLHGFYSLTPEAAVCYKVTAYYSREHDAGIAWNDADIGIDWPDIVDESLLSPKDRVQPRLRDLVADFQSSGETV